MRIPSGSEGASISPRTRYDRWMEMPQVRGEETDDDRARIRHRDVVPRIAAEGEGLGWVG